MKIKKSIRKIHRWIGLIAAIWLFLLASTGFLLQHSHDWQLDKKFISNSFVLKLYGIGEQFIAFKNDNHELIQIDKQLIQNNTLTLKLTENINAAVFHEENWIIATNKKLLWLNKTGQILQSMDQLDGLPIPIDNIGVLNQELVITSNNQIYKIKDLQPVDTKNIIWSKAITDNNVKKQALRLISNNYLNIEQFIFDLHAGITTPSLFNDIAAIALILLSLSGIFLFFRKNKQTNSQTK